MKLVGYCRVSSESQADNTSLTEQRKRIEAYCLAFGHELIQNFIEVGSAKDMTHRPQFQQAMELVAGDADGIIALKLDRIARSCRDVLTLVEDVLQPANKALVLLDLDVDTSKPTGKAILSMMAVVAELERATINDRCQGGRRAKAEAGGYAYGSPEFGRRSDGNGNKVVADDEMEIIEIIRRHRRAGKSFARIADWLNANGHKSKRGGKWAATTVQRVLTRAKTQA